MAPISPLPSRTANRPLAMGERGNGEREPGVVVVVRHGDERNRLLAANLVGDATSSFSHLQEAPRVGL